MEILFSDSDWESFSESGSSEGQEEIEFMYGGQARSIFSSLEESIGKIDDFLSFERGFMYGDTVRSVTNPSGQMGRVIGINMLVDLENMHGNVIKDVNSKSISKIRSISAGDYVVHGAWLGRVNNVIDRVTVVFDDGSKCEVTASDQEKILPVSTNSLDDLQYPYYPGQRVQVRLSNISKSARWLCGTWRENQVEGTVCEVDAGLVCVDWLAPALTGCGSDLPAPQRVLDSRRLTLLSCFIHANWQLGDWCLLLTADQKGMMDPSFSFIRTCVDKKLEQDHKRKNSSMRSGEIFVIVKTKTKVDIVWQDGSYSLGLDSQNLLPVSVVNSHEFWPQQFVLEKGIYDDPHVSNNQRWGVVQSVDAEEKTVMVKWRTTKAMEGTAESDGKRNEETLSAYELVEHPDYSYCHGDVVFKLVHNQTGTQAEYYRNNSIGISEEAALTSLKCYLDPTDCPDNYFLSCIGTIMGFEDGAVEVKWAAGFITKVAPNVIYGIDKLEASETAPALDEENAEELNQETHGNQNSNCNGKDSFSVDDACESCKRHSWESSSLYLPRAAIGFFTNIATSLFGSLGSSSLSGSLASDCTSEEANESEILLEKESLATGDICTEPHPRELRSLGNINLDQESEDNSEEEDFPLLRACEITSHVRQFDMANDCSDHHFLDASKAAVLPQVKKAWLKKVQQEWSVLEKNLPDSIYVCIYEQRMDLVRAAIIGAPGTPYHDGLFFFDMFLPPEYPYEPPSVHYNSGGLRVNPNLYESGKVCLSLLNTWTGTGSEVWNPESSTILQVLLSLQALVLNEKPYFNEAGYDKQIGRVEGEKNSISYNESAFLGTCKSMLYLLRKPPKHFEALVEEHFRRRAQNILLACKAYMGGAPVGCAFGCRKDGENSLECSTGFKIMLAKLFPKLVEAFCGKGIDCGQFTEPGK